MDSESADSCSRKVLYVSFNYPENFLAWGVKEDGKTTTTTKHNSRQFSQQCPEGPQQRHDLPYERSQTDRENQKLRQVLGDPGGRIAGATDLQARDLHRIAATRRRPRFSLQPPDWGYRSRAARG